MPGKEKTSAREYPNDAMTLRVKRALKSGRKMRLDADSWYVDVKTGELIGPDPAIEQPLTELQLSKAVVNRGGRPHSPNPKQAIKLRLDADVLTHFRSLGAGWQTLINAILRKAARLPARRA